MSVVTAATTLSANVVFLAWTLISSSNATVASTCPTAATTSLFWHFFFWHFLLWFFLLWFLFFWLFYWFLFLWLFFWLLFLLLVTFLLRLWHCFRGHHSRFIHCFSRH